MGHRYHWEVEWTSYTAEEWERNWVETIGRPGERTSDQQISGSNASSHGNPAGLEQLQCANCLLQGHSLGVCPKPNTDYGDITGCPFYNTRDHSVDECHFMIESGNPYENPAIIHTLVSARVNMPPIRSDIFNIGTWLQQQADEHGIDWLLNGCGLPWTREYVMALLQKQNNFWQGFNFAEREISQVLLGQDPLYTVDKFDEIVEKRWTYTQAKETWTVPNPRKRSHQVMEGGAGVPQSPRRVCHRLEVPLGAKYLFPCLESKRRELLGEGVAAANVGIWKRGH